MALFNAIPGTGRLHVKRRLIALEALLTIGVAWAALKLLPFRRAIRLGAVALPSKPPPDPARIVTMCAAAVHSASRFLPMRAVCIHQGLGLQRMLRRRGVDALLHYGIANDDDNALRAHVWVEAGGDTVIGGSEAAEFTRVATFP